MAPAVLLYDRDCRFCVWGVVGIARHARPGSLELAPIQGEEGDRLLRHLDQDARLASWHLWDGERLRSEADVLDGLAPLLSARELRLAVAVARALPRPAMSFAYRRMAANRATISRAVPERLKRRSAEALDGFRRRPAG